MLSGPVYFLIFLSFNKYIRIAFLFFFLGGGYKFASELASCFILFISFVSALTLNVFTSLFHCSQSLSLSLYICLSSLSLSFSVSFYILSIFHSLSAFMSSSPLLSLSHHFYVLFFPTLSIGFIPFFSFSYIIFYLFLSLYVPFSISPSLPVILYFPLLIPFGDFFFQHWFFNVLMLSLFFLPLLAWCVNSSKSVQFCDSISSSYTFSSPFFFLQWTTDWAIYELIIDTLLQYRWEFALLPVGENSQLIRQEDTILFKQEYR